MERRPWVFAAALVVLTALAAWGFSRPPAERPFGADDEGWREYLEVERAFALDSGVVVVVEAQDLFAPAALAALERVRAAVEPIRYVGRLLGPADVPPRAGDDAPWPAADADAAAREAARAAAHRHPLVGGQLLSADDKTLALPLIWGDEGYHGPGSWHADFLAHARGAAAGALRIRLSGPEPVGAATHAAFRRDHDRFRVIALVVVTLLAGYLFRDPGAVIVAGAAPLLGVFWALAAMRFLGLETSGFTQVVLPLLLVMIGFSDSVHLALHVRGRRAAGAGARAAARSALAHVFRPCFLTSLTTALGFAALARASSTTVRDFGVACALGTLCSFCAVVCLTPLLSLTVLGRGLARGHARDLPARRPDLFRRPLELVLAFPRSVALVGAIATAALAFGALGLRPHNRLSANLPVDSEAYGALAHCDRELGGAYPIAVLVEWENGVPASEWLAALERAEGFVRDEPLLAPPFSVNTLLGLAPGFGPPAARLAALAPVPSDVVRQVYQPARKRALVVSRVRDLGIGTYAEVYERLDARLAGLSRPGLRCALTGGPVVYGRHVAALIGELGRNLALAAAVILAVLGVAFRSWRLGLASVVPNLFPLGVTAGALLLAGGRVELASITAFTLCLGIAVDDTVHLLERYRRARADGLAPRDAVRCAVGEVATALWVTTIVMCAGFATLLSSPLPANRTFGWMSASTLLAAWVADMLLLPAFLVVFDRKR
jgi:hypothetical protein